MKTDKAVQTPAHIEQQEKQTTVDRNWTSTVVIVLIAFCTCAFILCFLISVGVLHYINQLENLLPPHVPYGNNLTILGLKVLHKLGLTTQSTFQLAGSNTVFTIITGIEFAIYALLHCSYDAYQPGGNCAALCSLSG